MSAIPIHATLCHSYYQDCTSILSYWNRALPASPRAFTPGGSPLLKCFALILELSVLLILGYVQGILQVGLKLTV